MSLQTANPGSKCIPGPYSVRPSPVGQGPSRRRSSILPRKLEYWSIGVLNRDCFHYSNTPILHHRPFATRTRIPDLFHGRILIWLCFLVFSLFAHAQDSGTISGQVVSSWDGTPLANVTVTVRGTTLAAQTDSTGRFELKNVPPGDQVLRFSKSGFASAVVTDARVLPGQATTVNGNLRPEFYEMEEYEITAEEFAQQTEQILIERQKSSVMIEALGSDFLSRVGAGNAAESIAKVSGATVVDGKFAVIRGLNDRYVTTTLNGASLPSADPYRQSASLDLFPAQVIDRVVVAKTFTPDQPGTFTGGGIDIVTRSFPEKPFLTASLGGAYNTRATRNEKFLTSDGGGLDWAGMDDGTRALPDELFGKTIPDAPVSSGSTNSALFRENLDKAFLLDQQTRTLGPAQFAPVHEAPPLDHNFSFAGGGSTRLFGGPLGYLASGSYKHDYSFYDNGVSSRYQNGDTQRANRYSDSRSLSTVNWSTMANLAYKPFADHEIGFIYFYNQNGINDSRVQDNGVENSDTSSTFRKFYLYWIERNLNTYQIKGEHRFPVVGGLQFNWLVALTETTQDEPDARFFNDVFQGTEYVTGGSTVPIPNNPIRYFRHLEENNQNVKLDFTLPIDNWTDEEGRFKFGVYDSSSERTFYDRALFYPGGGGYNSDPNLFLTENNLGLDSIRFNQNTLTFNWDRYFATFNNPFDSTYEGEQDVQAGYAMLDLPVFNRLRLVGGARYESTDLTVHSSSYQASSAVPPTTSDPPFIYDSKIAQSDLLPSAGLIFTIITNMNFRLNYSETIARPNFRELAAYKSYDPGLNTFIEGNPTLKMTAIKNYDARWEWFFRPGELISASLFYKELKNAIELGNIDVTGLSITWFNRPEAKLYGAEFEARKRLDFLGAPMGPFSVGGNLALVKSEVELTPDEYSTKSAFFSNLDSTRPLYDQAPYILNADVSYQNLRSGTTASVVFNRSGRRIVIAKLNASDVYERPVSALDFVISQKIGRHWSVKFAAKNLLNPEIKRTYGGNTKLLYSSYTKGRTFGLTLTYDF